MVQEIFYAFTRYFYLQFICAVQRKKLGSKATVLSFRSDVVSGIITKHHTEQRQHGGRPSGSGG